MKSQSIKTVLIMAGGTGGHIFPGLTVAHCLKNNNANVSWMGSSHGMENRLVPQEGIDLDVIRIKGLRGKGLATWVLAPLKIARSIFEALSILRHRRPDVVLSMGGYVSGPGGVAARLLNIPLVIHEQNSVAGLTNRVLSRWAKTICLGFPGSFAANAKTVYVGNPVRASISDIPEPAERLAGRDGKLRLLIIGGSQGARFLNRLLPEVIEAIDTSVGIEVIHQTGDANFDDVDLAYKRLNSQVKVMKFIDDIPSALSWADVLVCRSGALTVAEVMAAGVAAIFIPFPAAVDDHQTKNAEFLALSQASFLQHEKSTSAKTLGIMIEKLSRNRQDVIDISIRARHKFKHNAAAEISNICLKVARL